MSRSYRKPYSPVTGHSNSKDKLDARRSVRRKQNQAIRCFNRPDWDEFLMPERYECANNEVYGWSRDGKQKLQGWSHYYNNPFWVVCKYTWSYKTEEDIYQDWFERIARHAKWLDELKRK